MSIRAPSVYTSPSLPSHSSSKSSTDSGTPVSNCAAVVDPSTSTSASDPGIVGHPWSKLSNAVGVMNVEPVLYPAATSAPICVMSPNQTKVSAMASPRNSPCVKLSKSRSSASASFPGDPGQPTSKVSYAPGKKVSYQGDDAASRSMSAAESSSGYPRT